MIPRRLRLSLTGTSALDFLRLVDEKMREDRIGILAGGIAFNLLLAVVPFLMLVINAMAFFVGSEEEEATRRLLELVGGFLPVSPERANVLVASLRDVLSGALAASAAGSIAFVWFSARLFGSLRLVIAEVFDVEEAHNVVTGKLFDLAMALIGSLVVLAYLAVSAYTAIATSDAVGLLANLGLRDDIMTGLEEFIGRTISFLFLLVIFWLLYRFLVRKRVSVRSSLVAALFTSVMLELAKYVFGLVAARLSLGSAYSITIAAVLIALFWVYYVALIFVLGGEVAQVHGLLRARRIQRVVFE
jgi:membrane protein